VLSRVCFALEVWNQLTDNNSGFECDPDPSPGVDVWNYYCRTVGISVSSTNIPEFYTGKSFAQSTYTGDLNAAQRIAANSVQIRFQESDLPLLNGLNTGAPSTSTGSSTPKTGDSHQSQSSNKSNAANSSGSNSGSSPSNSGTSSPANAAPSLSAGAKAGIGVGVAIGVLALLAAIAAFFFFLGRAKRQILPDESSGHSAAYYGRNGEELEANESTRPPMHPQGYSQHSNAGSEGSGRQPRMQQIQYQQGPQIYSSDVWAKIVPGDQPLSPGEMDAGYPYYGELSSNATLRSNDARVQAQSDAKHGVGPLNA